MKKIPILVVDDEHLHRITLEDNLKNAGYAPVAAADGAAALEIARQQDFAIALIDLKLPKVDGITLMKRLKQLSPSTTSIIMTAYGSVESAITAIKEGAYDYIAKPFIFEELLITLKKVIDFQNLKSENFTLHKLLDKRYSLDKIIGKSPQMQRVYDLIETVATGAYNVLIIGETGTGKELVAQAIHRLSPRRRKPFVALNCAVLPESLLESELFGYEKGAFTGALKQRIGRFEQADQGTLFLDDMDDMQLAAQVKLLRVLQERCFERLGGSQSITIDVRLITATKKDLAIKVHDGEFREDLYYRLNVVPIHLPPLRERQGDIPLLVTHFIAKFCKQAGRPQLCISPDALKALSDYAWPGNVRELENTTERLVVLCNTDTIKLNDLPANISKQNSNISTISFDDNNFKELELVTREIEANYIKKVLAHTKGRKTEAAKILGISRKTLWEKLKSFPDIE